jgi:hypothetical protein
MRRKMLLHEGYCAVVLSDESSGDPSDIMVGCGKLLRYGRVVLFQGLKTGRLFRIPRKFRRRLLSVGPECREMLSGCEFFFSASSRFLSSRGMASEIRFEKPLTFGA